VCFRVKFEAEFISLSGNSGCAIPAAMDQPDETSTVTNQPLALIPRRYIPQKSQIPSEKVSRIVRLFMLGWKCEAIANACGVRRSTVFRFQKNLIQHHSIRRPSYRSIGRMRKLTKADEDAILNIFFMSPGITMMKSSIGYIMNEVLMSVNQQYADYSSVANGQENSSSGSLVADVKPFIIPISKI
jgi:hypothetical protein